MLTPRISGVVEPLVKPLHERLTIVGVRDELVLLVVVPVGLLWRTTCPKPPEDIVGRRATRLANAAHPTAIGSQEESIEDSVTGDAIDHPKILDRVGGTGICTSSAV